MDPVLLFDFIWNVKFVTVFAHFLLLFAHKHSSPQLLPMSHYAWGYPLLPSGVQYSTQDRRNMDSAAVFTDSIYLLLAFGLEYYFAFN